MDTVWKILIDFWDVLCDMSPYLLFGFAIAGGLGVLLSPKQIERHLGGEGFGASLRASLFGVPLPLCSCGVIPVAASLRRHCAGRGATVAFLISTPQTGVDSILVTYSLLGGVYAIFRPIVAFVSGLAGGLAAGYFADGPAAGDAADCCGSGNGHADGHAHSDACPTYEQPKKSPCCDDDGDHEETPSLTWRAKIRAAWTYGFVELPADIGKALLLGLLISALITALVPADFFGPVLGGGILAMLVMLVLGIPMYVCATASVPIAAALIMRGVSPGAALVFLMTGPATNAATIATIAKTMGKRTAMVYLATVAISAVLAGLLLDALFEVSGVTPGIAAMWMLPAWFETLCAVGLLALLGSGILLPLLRPKTEPCLASGEQQRTLRVVGMTCTHCEKAVRAALLADEYVRAVQVDLRTGLAVITGNDLPEENEALLQAVRDLGYQATWVDTNAANAAKTANATKETKCKCGDCE